MRWANPLQWREVAAARLNPQITARIKRASWWQGSERRNGSVNRTQPLVTVRLQRRYSFQQAASIGMSRGAEDVLARSQFNQCACIHHTDLISDMRHYR